MEEKSEHIIRREHFVAGVETGIDSERERIIALLEAKGSKFVDSHDWADVELITYLVALIKGENK